jgi:hypothetical protein
MADKIIEACWPIVDVLQGMSYPLTYVMVASGILLMIGGSRRQGIQVMKMAVIGYLSMQMLPAAMKLLRDVGQAMMQ